MAFRDLKVLWEVLKDGSIKKTQDVRQQEIQKNWWNRVKKSVKSEWEPVLVRGTFEVLDEEVEKLRKFFEGAIVPYYAIQNEGGEVGSETVKLYRELLWKEILGFELELPDGSILHKRKSSKTLKKVQDWLDKIEELKVEIFDKNGYIFPDSKKRAEAVERYLAIHKDYSKAVYLADKGLKNELIKKIKDEKN